LSLAELLLAVGKVESAWSTSRRACDVFESLSLNVDAAHCLVLQGEAETTKGDGHQAYASLSQAITIFADSGDVWGMANGLYHLGELCLLSGHKDAAHSALWSARGLYARLHARATLCHATSCWRAIT